MNVLVRLQEEGVVFARSEHAPTFTAQGLAAVEHVSGWNVAKPVLVKGKGQYTLCVIPAPAHLDLHAVAAALCEDDVELATEAEMAGVFSGCELGAEPPIGAYFGLRTLADYMLMDDDYVVFQAGSHTESVRMSRADFERIADPLYAEIVVHAATTKPNGDGPCLL